MSNEWTSESKNKALDVTIPQTPLQPHSTLFSPCDACRKVEENANKSLPHLCQEIQVHLVEHLALLFWAICPPVALISFLCHITDILLGRAQ